MAPEQRKSVTSDIDCRPRSAKLADWLYDEAFPVAVIVVGGVLSLVFSVYREWTIWNR